MPTCLNCDRTKGQIPLLSMQFRGETIHICAQCLPLLIHKPEKLVDKLPGMDILKPAEQV